MAGAAPTRASRRLASATGTAEGSPLKSLPLTSRRTTRTRRAVAKPANASNHDDVLPSREETESRSASPPAQQQKPPRRSNRTVSRSVSPSLNAPPPAKPRQASARSAAASARKIAEPKTTATRRKKAAVASELPAITESPVKSPPGAFPVEYSPARSAKHTSSIALTPAHLSTATKRAHDSSTDRSVESPSNLTLFKRARVDDWTPSKQLQGFFTGSASSTHTTPVAAQSAADNVDVYTHTSPASDAASGNNNSVDAEPSVASTHSSPASHDASTPVAHGFFARITSYLPSMSARSSRIQAKEPAAITSPTPNHNNGAQPTPLGSAKASAVPSQAEESPLPLTTPSHGLASAARYASAPNLSSPEDFMSIKRSGFRYTPKPTIPVTTNDDAGYESDEIRDIIEQASTQKAPTREQNRAYVRKLEREAAERRAGGVRKAYGSTRDGLVVSMLASQPPKNVHHQGKTLSGKSGSGSMKNSSSVRSFTDVANSAVGSVPASAPTPFISHSVHAASRTVNPLHSTSDSLIQVPAAALVLPINDTNESIFITDNKIIDSVRVLVAYSQSNPEAHIPDPEQMVALLDQYNQSVNVSDNKDTSMLDDVFTTESSTQGLPEHGFVHEKIGSTTQVNNDSEYTMRGALGGDVDDDAELSSNPNSSPFINTPAAQDAPHTTSVEEGGSPLKKLISSAKNIMASPLSYVFNSPQTSSGVNALGATPSRRHRARNTTTKNGARATPFGSPVKSSNGPRSALKVRPDDDVHKSQRQAKRVNWDLDKEQDNTTSFDSSSTQNDNGKRPFRGTYSADLPDSVYESDDDASAENTSEQATEELEKARDNESLEPSSAEVSASTPKVKGTYSADIYGSDEEDDDDYDSMSDAELRGWLLDDDEIDLKFIHEVEETHPRAAERLWKFYDYAKREKQMEVDMANKKPVTTAPVSKTPRTDSRDRYLAGTLFSSTTPAFGALSPLSERSENTPSRENGTVVAQSTPLPPSKVETLPATSNQSPLKERAWPQTPAAPVTPYKKSYTPSVSSGLRNVTIASPIHPTLSPFSAADAAPSPDLAWFEKAMKERKARNMSAADNAWNVGIAA